MFDDPEPFLILHKVRGEPAFDVATKIMIGDEEGWIIPTSGHRAYPEWTEPLNRAIDFEMCRINGNRCPDSVSDDLPDHYTVNEEKITGKGGLLEKLGLKKKPSQPLVRRRFT